MHWCLTKKQKCIDASHVHISMTGFIGQLAQIYEVRKFKKISKAAYFNISVLPPNKCGLLFTHRWAASLMLLIWFSCGSPPFYQFNLFAHVFFGFAPFSLSLSLYFLGVDLFSRVWNTSTHVPDQLNYRCQDNYF